MTPENIQIIQEQSAMVAETSLSTTMNRCLLNKYCRVATAPTARIPADSIASGLLQSYQVVDAAIEHAGRSLPNLLKIKSAFELGRETGSEDLCEKVFPCGREINLPTEHQVQARIAVPNCGELSMVCPGVSAFSHERPLTSLPSCPLAARCVAATCPPSAGRSAPWPASSVAAPGTCVSLARGTRRRPPGNRPRKTRLSTAGLLANITKCTTCKNVN
jgi:hypothetical protein